jgi:hypothetical protein
MGHRLRWNQLSVGVAALLAVLGTAVLILTFGRVGVMRGEKFRLYVATDAARGVVRGSEVWLDGQRVGVVKNVAFRSPTAPPTERLVLALDVTERQRQRIRLDSHVQVRAGANIIGDRVVYVSSGTLGVRSVVDGDTLRAAKQPDTEEFSSEAALAARQFPGIIENVKLVSAAIKGAEGTLGALTMDHDGLEMRRIHARTQRLFSRLSGPNGTIGKARDESAEIRERASIAMARVDSLRRLLTSNQFSLGRFRRDSSIVREIARTRDELAELRRIAAEPGTSLGRMRSDSAIVRGIHRDLIAIDSLRADMKKHPFRYIVF